MTLLVTSTRPSLRAWQDGGNQLAGEPLEEEQRQEAVIPGVIHVQHDHGRCLGVAGDEGFGETLGQNTKENKQQEGVFFHTSSFAANVGKLFSSLSAPGAGN